MQGASSCLNPRRKSSDLSPICAMAQAVVCRTATRTVNKARIKADKPQSDWPQQLPTALVIKMNIVSVAAEVKAACQSRPSLRQQRTVSGVTYS